MNTKFKFTEKTVNTLLYVGAAVLILAILGLSIFAFASRKDKDKTPEPTITTTVPATKAPVTTAPITAITPETTDTTETPQAPDTTGGDVDGNSSLGFIIGIGVMALVALGGGVMFTVFSKKKR